MNRAVARVALMRPDRKSMSWIALLQSRRDPQRYGHHRACAQRRPHAVNSLRQRVALHELAIVFVRILFHFRPRFARAAARFAPLGLAPTLPFPLREHGRLDRRLFDINRQGLRTNNDDHAFADVVLVAALQGEVRDLVVLRGNVDALTSRNLGFANRRTARREDQIRFAQYLLPVILVDLAVDHIDVIVLYARRLDADAQAFPFFEKSLYSGSFMLVSAMSIGRGASLVHK